VKSKKDSVLDCQRPPAVPARYEVHTIHCPGHCVPPVTASWVRTESDTCHVSFRVVGTAVTVIGKWRAKHEKSFDLDSGGTGEVRVTEIS
jgi:hypothetical protein